MSNTPRLLDRLRVVDSEATPLLTTGDTEWVRTRLGVIGQVQLDEHTPIETAPQIVSEKIEMAHALLDQLPLSDFRRSDLWNLLLFVCVPYESTIPQDLAAPLESRCSDLVGSRKLLLWRGQRLEDQLRPLLQRVDGLVGPADPLREVLLSHARHEAEKRALEVLFKRRLDDDDIDELVRSLGREVMQ